MAKAIYMTAVLSLSLMAAGCVSIPEFDDRVDSPAEFQTEIDNLDGYPDTSLTPARPVDLRSDASWDAAASALLARSNAFDSVQSARVPTDSELLSARNQLLAMVNAYKLDDPQPR